MCPYPDVPASVRGSRPSPPLELDGAGLEQGHRARTSLERALRKYPQRNQADITLCIPRSATAKRELTWRYPLMCRRSPLASPASMRYLWYGA